MTLLLLVKDTQVGRGTCAVDVRCTECSQNQLRGCTRYRTRMIRLEPNYRDIALKEEPSTKSSDRQD